MLMGPRDDGGNILFFLREEDVFGYAKRAYGRTLYGWSVFFVGDFYDKKQVLENKKNDDRGLI
jgi:hypothetical protein